MSAINKKHLIEEVGLRMEERLNISPLAARIYSLLTLSSYEGLTFDEIRETIEASKSSISVNVNLLTQLGYVDYHTKSGDRKRYFKVAKYFQLKSLELFHLELGKDAVMVDKINSFNKDHYPQKFTTEKSLGLITKKYLRAQQKLVKKAINKILAFQKSDQSFY